MPATSRPTSILFAALLSLTACTAGPAGSPGPAGPRGTDGPIGPAYHPAVSTLSNDATDTPIGEPVDVRQKCSDDMIAISGGCSAHGVALDTNAPDTVVPDAPDGWACIGTATDAKNDVSVTVVCLAR
jgi:hypothetical protein